MFSGLIREKYYNKCTGKLNFHGTSIFFPVIYTKEFELSDKYIPSDNKMSCTLNSKCEHFYKISDSDVTFRKSLEKI